jgi:hypothetical protein
LNEQLKTATRVPRFENLTVEAFLSTYVQKNQPVIVTGAMRDWKALAQWGPESLVSRFGNESVQVYGDLFRLAKIMPLSAYLEQHFNRSNAAAESGRPRSVPYVRWYCHLVGDDRVPWADGVFTRLMEEWARPAFFPPDSFALPFCSPTESIDPSRDWFPARGLFISGQGARTRLHADPWCSDALLCQIYGRKEFVMFEPSQGAYLANGERLVDIEAPDREMFPEFPQATEAVRDTLEPGEILLVPAGWYHHFKSVTDSVSLTWNFVHDCRLGEYLSYLGRGPAENEIKQLSYAYFDSPGHRQLDAEGFSRSLLASRKLW